MSPSEFATLFDETVASCAALLSVKRGEYAGEAGTKDVLTNFKEGGRQLHIAPEKYLMVLAHKHYSSLANYADDVQRGTVRPQSEPIQGRIYDLINYCILLLGLVDERAETAVAVQVEGRRLSWEDEQ